jgi:hypothetical protein
MNTNPSLYPQICISDRLHPEPGSDGDAVAGESLVAAEHQGGGFRRLAGEFGPPEQAIEHVVGQGLPRLDFYRIEAAGIVEVQLGAFDDPFVEVAVVEGRRKTIKPVFNVANLRFDRKFVKRW